MLFLRKRIRTLILFRIFLLTHWELIVASKNDPMRRCIKELPYIIKTIQSPCTSVCLFSVGQPCCCWLHCLLKPSQRHATFPGPPGQPELRAQTASAATSDGWRSEYPPSGCREPTSRSWRHRTNFTRQWRFVSFVHVCCRLWLITTHFKTALEVKTISEISN